MLHSYNIVLIKLFKMTFGPILICVKIMNFFLKIFWNYDLIRVPFVGLTLNSCY